jgi:hypothetical protein
MHIRDDPVTVEAVMELSQVLHSSDPWDVSINNDDDDEMRC